MKSWRQTLLDNSHIQIAPSILSADFAELGRYVAMASESGADSIHVDIMDGQFVPTITWGPRTVEAIKKWSNVPLDVHLMIYNPENQVDSFIDAGANTINVHVESCNHLNRTIQQIKARGAKAGVAINPSTPLSVLQEILPFIDPVLVMSVNPGFPSQKYIPGSEGKISRVKEMISQANLDVTIEVDGGINADTARLAVNAGADILVAGSAIYDHQHGVKSAIELLRSSISS